MRLTTTAILLPLLSLLSPTQAKPGSCPNAKYPTKPQYIEGYTAFCDNYMPVTGYYNLHTDDTLIANSPLIQADGSTARWVFKISIWTSNSYSNLLVNKYVDKDVCLRHFGAMLDLGGMGRDWCTVDGMFVAGEKGNEDLVAFKGGKNSLQIREIGNTQVVFESYRMRV
ncbi:hypothetical protein HBI88_233620 [Parastagonospora nodorum]|nr:hypothetical protein HBI97_213570 [Parastagonospora nodorum]KAH5791121.1 hypothetical protein HBI96_204040 [Parastagonospora nodorum]KAH5799533.1 hypothetical protein HBI94_227180 [Parastagonospora nodorum]KAH5810497.1 hypothetical protein HBI93_230580 [Parastagonospora nodorum]KAH5846651.1 hypothetical protein HBI91_217660 [Parastagonospora nodorum]